MEMERERPSTNKAVTGSQKVSSEMHVVSRFQVRIMSRITMPTPLHSAVYFEGSIRDSQN
jgi:hypothetical protein